MNEHFVNIKVDREERPDLDQIYQIAHALLTRRSGGWPLTMFLTPAGAPFFGGTYFPKTRRYGMPGFIDLLPRVAAAYREQGDRIAEQNERLVEAHGKPRTGGRRQRRRRRRRPRSALAGSKHSFDPEHGGFGAAPKFPHPAELEFCLRAWGETGDAEALAIVRTTLDAHGRWRHPRSAGRRLLPLLRRCRMDDPAFREDALRQRPAARRCTRISRAPPAMPRFEDVARDIVGWLMREMRAPDGAFYSSLDADSEGHEGKFYVWTPDEVRALLTPDEWAVAAPHFGLDRPPNFEGHAWNLRVVEPLDDVAATLGSSPPDARTRLAGARAALFAAREKRVRPGRDDKILTSWNALMIAGLARAARALDVPRWADLAFAAADALRRTAWRDGRLLATRRGDRADLNAYLDDYAFLLEALLELMQTRFRARGLRLGARARRRAARALRGHGAAAASSSRATITSGSSIAPSRGHDNATPSGNGVAARALIAFGHLAVRAAIRRRCAALRAAFRARAGRVSGRLFDAPRSARRSGGPALGRAACRCDRTRLPHGSGSSKSATGRAYRCSMSPVWRRCRRRW